MMRIFCKCLTATLAVAFGLSVVSCKDDDNNESLSPEEQAAQEADAQVSRVAKYWGVVSQLVGADAYTDDYAGKTFAPVIGEATTGNETVRQVITADYGSAIERFCDIVGIEAFDTTTSTYTWDDADVGTLTFSRGQQGRSLATVDVNIREVPALRQIVYLTSEQAGTNASKLSTCYYRFGDVVTHVNEDGFTEYWICVRPSFEPEGKKDSHWVCINRLPSTMLTIYTSKTNGKTYALPKADTHQEEHQQNLAELLYAILMPEQWEKNITDHSTEGIFGVGGLRFFHDFHKSNIKYNSSDYFKRVRAAWENEELFRTIFGYTSDDLLKKVLLGQGPGHGLNLITYSTWSTTWSNSPTLYQYNYTNGTGKESNMHKQTFTKVSKQVIDKKNPANDIVLNFQKKWAAARDSIINKAFFGDEYPRYLFRYKTGKELGMGNYDTKSKIAGSYTDLYRYNDYYYKDLNLAPETRDEIRRPASNCPLGYGAFTMGDVLQDEDGAKWFCIRSSGKIPTFPFVKDHTAIFVSMDRVTHDIYKAFNIVTEDSVTQLAYRFAHFLHTLMTQQAELKYDYGSQNGSIVDHIKKYAGVDLNKLFVFRDSIYTYTVKNKKHNSESQSKCFNLAYNDPSTTNDTPILRVIHDMTQAGDNREASPYKDWYYRLYKHYQTYSDDMEDPRDELQKSLGWTLWNAPWQMTEKRIMLSDVRYQNIVDKYAKMDKWVTLPLFYKTGWELLPEKPRTKAETMARPEEFVWKNGDFATNKKHMYNEPVLFMRMTAITDDGPDLDGSVGEIISTDGRKFTIVHLQNDKRVYQCGGIWPGEYWVERNSSIYLDNKLIELPPLAGWVMD